VLCVADGRWLHQNRWMRVADPAQLRGGRNWMLSR